MHVRFLLGPAGSGKTYRCLDEIRKALVETPMGDPLLLLAPKQSTYQLERQLLEDLPGFSRLHILSFPRLARFIFDKERRPIPKLLSNDGRLMVLRALIEEKRDQLRLFRSVAHLPGFIDELSSLLRELRQSRITVQTLQRLRPQLAPTPALNAKINDMMVILSAYDEWLRKENIHDLDALLDLASDLLSAKESTLKIDRIWVDGFAEMTPQETALLHAVVRHSSEATLAFCLDPELKQPSWLSAQSSIENVYHNVRNLFDDPAFQVTAESLERNSEHGRFCQSTELAMLEKSWLAGVRGPLLSEARTGDAGASAIELQVCETPADEARSAAGAILQFVANGGRFREVAVIVRQLEPYADILRRIFHRFGIPFFMDQRSPLSNHPAVSLTRSALRLIAFGWQNEDWFGGLKTGLLDISSEAVDELENAALACGWSGELWQKPLPRQNEHPQLERFRAKAAAPFLSLHARLAPLRTGISGAHLASFIEQFWGDIHLRDKLQKRSTSPEAGSNASDVEEIVWNQLQEWLENLRLAFSDHILSLAEFLEIIEAGLQSATVGLIPPSIDQVLIGAVDRSRNPDIRLALALGMNAGVFPSKLSDTVLLTASERQLLDDMNCSLSLDWHRWQARENFLGYIACTRSRQKLFVSHSLLSSDEKPLAPSVFFERLCEWFPNSMASPEKCADNKIALEWIPRLRKHGLSFEAVQKIRQANPAAEFAATPWNSDPSLSAEQAAKLYGNPLQISVTQLERFSACSFQFFASAGLHARERKLYELDRREAGRFQHELLARFHNELAREGRKWRDITPDEGKRRVREIAETMQTEFEHGLASRDAATALSTRQLTKAVEGLVEATITWMRRYRFDPALVEQSFGMDDKGWAGWKIELGDGRSLVFRGVIDRIDLHTAGEVTHAVVIDYKATERLIDPLLLAHGIQIQLPAYLALLMGHEAGAKLGKEVQAAGMFYVPLQNKRRTEKTRSAAMNASPGDRFKSFQHAGRFAFDLLDRFASPSVNPTDDAISSQFRYRLRKDGKPYESSKDVSSSAELKEIARSIETLMIQLGKRIYEGEIALNPYKKQSKVACKNCLYQAVCRIDTASHAFRILSETAGQPEIES